MRKYINKLGLASSVLALAMVSGSAVFALPSQANAHAQAANTTTTSTTDPSGSGATQPGNAGSAHAAAGKLKACQNREAAVNNIMQRIDTRAQNQLTLFGTIATRVENFYTAKGKTVSNYDQLVAAISTAKTQAETDLSTMQSNSTFSCSSSNPKATVTAFQSYLKTEIGDLQSYRTAVKNLIVAVAKANGATVSGTGQTSDTSTQSSTQGGQ